jgi:hypothetical protein
VAAAALWVAVGVAAGRLPDGVGSADGSAVSTVDEARGTGTGEWLAATAPLDAGGRTQPTMPAVMATSAAPPTTAGNR